MSDDFLKNPLSLFDVRGKSAIVTGASGAFGALASKVLAGAASTRLQPAPMRSRGSRRNARSSAPRSRR